MVHQLGEHVDGNPGVGVPLGVGVPVGVGDDPGLVELGRRRGSAAVARLSPSRGAAGPSVSVLIGRRPPGLRQRAGQQLQLAGRGVREPVTDSVLAGRGSPRRWPRRWAGGGRAGRPWRCRRPARRRRRRRGPGSPAGRARMSSGRRPVSIAIWIAVRASAGCRLSRLAHSAAMISGGRSRPGSPRSGSGGDVAAADHEVAGQPGGGLPGPGQADRADPGQHGLHVLADDGAVAAADRARRFLVGQPGQEGLDVGPAQAGRCHPVIAAGAQACGQPGQRVDLGPDLAGPAAAVAGQFARGPGLRGLAPATAG